MDLVVSGAAIGALGGFIASVVMHVADDFSSRERVRNRNKPYPTSTIDVPKCIRHGAVVGALGALVLSIF